MDELELIRRLVPYLAPSGGDLLIAAGEDDAAAWRAPGGGYTVATCDTSVEKIHFDLSRQPPEDVGWRALAFALGDLAAKGAQPAYGMAALALPARWVSGVAEGIYRGMAELARLVDLRLVGGDTTRSPEYGLLTIFALGWTETEPLPRSAVRPGWSIGVTGPLGGASLEWARPRPQLGLGAELCRAGMCCGDISDGLLRELDKFSAAAGVGARLVLDAVPLVPGAPSERAIASGEEVELVCCGEPPLPPGLVHVGELTSDGRVVVVAGDGRELSGLERGYDHFG